MKTAWRKPATRCFLSFLLSLGLILTLLNGLDLPVGPGILISAAFLSALLEVISLNRKTRLIGGPALGAAALLWLLFAGGFGLLQNLLRAFSLHLSGIPFALPLVAGEFSACVSVVITVLCFFCSRESAGGVPAPLLAVAALLLIWLSDRFFLIWSLSPALVAALTLLILDTHEEIAPFRVLPWVAGLVLLSALLTPASGLLSPPLKERADQLRQSILDHLFYTEPRDVFSLLNEGFYPEGSGQLGGKPAPSDHLVMYVSTPRTAYLRGVALNEYDGRCWKNTLGGRRYLWDSPSSAQNRRRLFDQALPAQELNASITDPLSVSVRMVADSASTLFVPQRIRELRVGGGMVPYFSNSSELFITRNLQAGDTWSVSAPLFQGGDPGLSVLVEAAESDEDPLWNSVLETYTRLPSHLEEPVWQMALDVTSPHSSAYNKAYALESFLLRSYRYTLDVEPQPSNLDFVTNFLFNTGEGYCTYFASAMTVLCRMAGLPARYVEGYLAQPDAWGQAMVTGLNAHAWTEVYFKGFGWVTFDATPRTASSSGESGVLENPQPNGDAEPTPENAGILSPDGRSGSAPTPTPEPLPTEEIDPELSDEDSASPDSTLIVPQQPSGLLSPWLLLLLPLLALLLLLIRWLRSSPESREKRAPDPETRFEIWLHEVSARLSARKLTRQSGETPMSYTRRLDASEDLPVALSQLGECVSLLRYGNATPQENDLHLVRDVALALRVDQSPSVRLRYALHRLIKPYSS